MNHPTPNRPAALIAAFILICVTLFPLQGTAQDELQTVSARQIDSLAPRGDQMNFISLDPVFFEFDQSTLDTRAKSTLDTAARYIQAHPGIIDRIIIKGHADSKASDTYNYKLADLRAAAVRDYLASQGVSDRLFYVAGLGEHFPDDEYWTREGQRRNRRTSIYIVELR